MPRRGYNNYLDHKDVCDTKTTIFTKIAIAMGTIIMRWASTEQYSTSACILHTLLIFIYQEDSEDVPCCNGKEDGERKEGGEKEVKGKGKVTRCHSATSSAHAAMTIMPTALTMLMTGATPGACVTTTMRLMTMFTSTHTVSSAQATMTTMLMLRPPSTRSTL